jgi:phage tail sheath gpL-like
VDTLTPNSFPVATFQVISITWTRTNNTTYTVVINGVTCSYTSDASATDAEISAGLSAAINNNVGAAVTATNAKPVVVTSDVLGQAFTYSGTNVTITLTTANVPREQYSVTVGSRPTYNFLSDGTPTAAEVVAGLTALINADALRPMTASGTTVLTLTGKVLGEEITVSQSANLTFSETTPSTTATNVVTQLKTLINGDAGCAVAATGTTTLILTAKVTGTAFTYSGTANLTQVLTTANVAQVLYSGNWIISVIKASTATHFNTGVPIVAGQWYRIKAIINATGTQAAFYVDNLFIDEIVTPCPAVGLRYVFKLEKTLGTVSRTTSIDYISWRRTRG